MPFPTFSAGLSSKKNTKENAVVSCLFYPSQVLSVLIQCLRERRNVKQRRHQEVKTSVATATNINVLVLAGMCRIARIAVSRLSLRYNVSCRPFLD